jgi:hypothetical protein
MMSQEITADDLELAFHQAAVAITRAKTDVGRAPDIVLAKDFFRVNRSAREVLKIYSEIEHRAFPGMTLQRIETDLASLTTKIATLLGECQKAGLDKNWITKHGYYSLLSNQERFRDFWVAFSSSIDPDLPELLKRAESEESVPWDSSLR